MADNEKQCWICCYAGTAVPTKTLIGKRNVCAEGTGCTATRARHAQQAKDRWAKAFGRR